MRIPIKRYALSTAVLLAAVLLRWVLDPVLGDTLPLVTLSGGPAGAMVRVYKISSAGRLSFISDGPEVVRHTDAGGTYVARVTDGSDSTVTYTLTVQTSP